MENVKKVIILGVGGICIDILDTIQEINERSVKPLYECIGFLDDSEEKQKKEFSGVKVLGPITMATEFSDVYFVNGIGNAENFSQKKSLQEKARIPEEKYLTLVHPTASVSRMATLGRGAVVLQQVSIASNVMIGNHVLIMPSSVISHDTVIGDYTFVTAGSCISGGVKIGTACYLGTNCSVKGNIIIADGSLIGMGSVVLENIPQNCVYVGNPAKFLKNL